MRFLEKDEKGNVNSSTRVPLHPVRAKSASFVGKERYLWIANFTRYIHVGLLISTLPASVPERETIELFREMSRNDSFFLPFITCHYY